MELHVEKFDSDSDGDCWFSVVSKETGDVATGVMHETQADAEAELRELK